MQSQIAPPVADSVRGVDANARISDVPVIYTYLTIPKNMKGMIPHWLWLKKVENVATGQRVMSEEPSPLLFEAKSADLKTMMEDFAKRNIRPFHIHLMSRTNGNTRVRVSWLPGHQEEFLAGHEVDWVVMMFHRFVWDVMAHRSMKGTGHLPPHIAVNSAYPTERGQATTVESVQILKGALALIYDPDSAQ